MRTKRPGRLRTLAAASLAALFGLPHGGCTPDFAESSQATVILRILGIEGESGDDQEQGSFINSDVSPVFNDNAVVTLEALPKNPNFTGNADFESVLATRYEVRYLRSDGQGREGIDVPYRISGGLSTIVPFGDTSQVSFVVVRHQAKQEAPLANLVDAGSRNNNVVLTCVAEITIHGRTTSGREVRASGFLTINFADFADE
jgi:hypothetical protein